jgi:DNA ligase-1
MVLLAKRWNTSINPTGYWGSEKMDGFRCYWNSTQLLSRNGNVIYAPRWFTKDLPKIALDGEIWAGRGSFERVASVVKGSRENDWRSVVFAVFDAPEHKDLFEGRIQEAKRVLTNKSAHAVVIPFWMCTSRKQLLEKLDEIVNAGGEGIMLRQARSIYINDRSDILLKVKKWYDEEAVVIGYEPSKVNKKLCGALKVITPDGRIFKVAGFDMVIANNPPPIGTIITYKYTALSKEGIPRPAVFERVRDV